MFWRARPGSHRRLKQDWKAVLGHVGGEAVVRCRKAEEAGKPERLDTRRDTFERPADHL